MMRKCLLLILCLTLVLGIVPPVSAASKTDAELVLVSVHANSNLAGEVQLIGYYQDNYFYIDAKAFCQMTGAAIQEESAQQVTFTMHEGLRRFTVTASGEVIEAAGKKSLTRPVETLVQNDTLYMSAPEMLSYAGATVGFGQDETALIHMMVTMPYTLCDLFMEYHAYDGLAFSWAEAEGKLLDPEEALELAALDTILLGYDASVISYALPGYADQVENTILTDVLLELLRNEAEELVAAEDFSVQILGNLNDGAKVSFEWIKKTMEWASLDDLDKTLAQNWSSCLDVTGTVLDLTAGCIASLETAKQFANLTATQKVLMEKTLCRVAKGCNLYDAYPSMFEAAASADALIKGKYASGEKAAVDSMYKLVSVGAEAFASSNPISIAWNMATNIAKITPGITSLLEDEKAITFAGECSNVRILASQLLSMDANRMTQNNNYLGKSTVSNQEQMKYDIILSLKASLTARLLLLETGWLTEDAADLMQMRAEWTAELLNKAQNARPVPFGVYEKNEQDISWIEKLACVGKMGNVVTVGTDTYYWRYHAESFSENFYNSVGMVKSTNAFVRLDKDGKQHTLFALQGYGEFIIANGVLFYENGEGDICSIRLDGTDKTRWGEGSLRAVTEDGSKIIYDQWGGDNHLMVIDQTKGTQEVLSDATRFVTYYKGVIYFEKEVDYEEGQKGVVDLWRILPDATEAYRIHMTQPDLYDSSVYSTASVDHMRFTDKYIYFSYGSIAGTGSFFQGGRVIRVGYDGTGAQVVGGQNDTVDGQFTVTANDQVTTYQNGSLPKWGWGNPLQYHDGNVYILDQKTGEPQLMLSPGDYSALSSAPAGTGDAESVLVSFVEAHGDKLYYLVHHTVYNPEISVWWAAYHCEGCAMMVKDTKTGKVTVLYQIQ